MLNYIENHLNENEVLIYKARKSPLLLAKPALIALLLLVIGFVLNEQTRDGASLALCALAAAGYVGAKWLLLRQEELAVTSRRIVSKRGLIRRSVQDCPLDKVDTVQVGNGILGSILGYGTVAVTAVNGAFAFDHIVDPGQFRNQVMGAIESEQDARMARQMARMAGVMQGMGARVG